MCGHCSNEKHRRHPPSQNRLVENFKQRGKAMRNIFIGIILFNLAAFAAEEVKLPVDEAGKVTYTEVVTMEGQTQDALYSRALEWFAKTFNSAKNVIQMQDKENGKLIGKALIPITVKDISRYPAGVVSYTLSISTKEGKYKYEVIDFLHDNRNESRHGSGGDLSSEKPECGKGFLGQGGLTKSFWRQIKRQTDENIKALIENLKAFMAGQGTKDNW
jgi:hypothetical protein